MPRTAFLVFHKSFRSTATLPLEVLRGLRLNTLKPHHPHPTSHQILHPPPPPHHHHLQPIHASYRPEGCPWPILLPHPYCVIDFWVLLILHFKYLWKYFIPLVSTSSRIPPSLAWFNTVTPHFQFHLESSHSN